MNTIDNYGAHISLIKSIDEITHIIWQNLQKKDIEISDLHAINELLEKRFQLLKSLLDYAAQHLELRAYLADIINNEQDMVTIVQAHKEKVGHTLRNVNSLDDYLKIDMN